MRYIAHRALFHYQNTFSRNPGNFERFSLEHLHFKCGYLCEGYFVKCMPHFRPLLNGILRKNRVLAHFKGNRTQYLIGFNF